MLLGMLTQKDAAATDPREASVQINGAINKGPHEIRVGCVGVGDCMQHSGIRPKAGDETSEIVGCIPIIIDVEACPCLCVSTGTVLGFVFEVISRVDDAKSLDRLVGIGQMTMGEVDPWIVVPKDDFDEEFRLKEILKSVLQARQSLPMKQDSGEIELIFERRFLSFGYVELEHAEAQVHGFAGLGPHAVGNEMRHVIINTRYDD